MNTSLFSYEAKEYQPKPIHKAEPSRPLPSQTAQAKERNPVEERSPAEEPPNSFEAHVQQEGESTVKPLKNQAKKVSPKAEVAAEKTATEEVEEGGLALEGLDQDQVKKIEKTVRKLLLDSIHLSPEKFNQLQEAITTGKELGPELQKVLRSVEKLVSSLKNIAGKTTDKLTMGDIKHAVAIMGQLKKAIQSGDSQELSEKLQQILNSDEAQKLLQGDKLAAETIDAVDSPVSSPEKSSESLLPAEKPLKEASSTPATAKDVPAVASVNRVESQGKSISEEAKDLKPQVHKKENLQKSEEPEKLLGKSENTEDKAPKKAVPLNAQSKPLPKKDGVQLDRANVKQTSKNQAQVNPKQAPVKLSGEQQEVIKSIKKVTVETVTNEPELKNPTHKNNAKPLIQNESLNRHLNSQANQRANSEQQADEEFSKNQKENHHKSLAENKKPLNFLKKLKNILNKKEGGDFSLSEQQSAKVNNKTSLNFLNKLNGSHLAKQIVSKIDQLLKGTQTTKTTIDLQAPGMGDMKIAAEVTGAKLSVSLSSLSQSIRAELMPLRQELSEDLKALGFDDVELGFDLNDDGQGQRNAFEDQLEQKRQKDPVKLPGDYLADLAEISEWLQSFNAS
jgi:hypothetical protein